MSSLGYQARFPQILSKSSGTALVPGEYNYRDEKRRTIVELHTELTLRHFPVKPNLDRFAQRLVKIVVAGQDVKTFVVEDLLPVLCVHGSKDFWARISWIADVAELDPEASRSRLGRGVSNGGVVARRADVASGTRAGGRSAASPSARRNSEARSWRQRGSFCGARSGRAGFGPRPSWRQHRGPVPISPAHGARNARRVAVFGPARSDSGGGRLGDGSTAPCARAALYRPAAAAAVAQIWLGSPARRYVIVTAPVRESGYRRRS